jgi:hypothetical protein
MPLRLTEIEDASWCPPLVRTFALDHLRTLFTLLHPYRRIERVLAQAVKDAKATRIIDLCSGSGGPWMSIRPPCPVILTDQYPQPTVVQSLPQEVTYFNAPVDARTAPDCFDGFLTLFTAFHHFSPQEGKALLERAATRGQGIAVFETTERSMRSLVLIILSVLSVFLLAPVTKPFGVGRLILTYLIPMVPALLLFDGIVSVLHSYSPAELRKLSEGLGGTDYTWRSERIPGRGLMPPLTFLVGVPGNTHRPSRQEVCFPLQATNPYQPGQAHAPPDQR